MKGRSGLEYARFVGMMTTLNSVDSVKIEVDGIQLEGELCLPKNCKGIVLFAHGSGSSRKSPRNIQVARGLNEAGIGTLLFDLLTSREENSRENVFDLPLLAGRLVSVTHWVREQAKLAALPIGYFGASTGAGAALWAAADLRDLIVAVVSRGGRADLAEKRLREVKARTLLIVGGNDEPVLTYNRQALQLLTAGRLAIVPGATHLFEEPGALEAVTRHASEWFLRAFSAKKRQVA